MKNSETKQASKWGWMTGQLPANIEIPKRIPYTKLQLFFDMLCVLLMISVGIFLALRWGDIPSSIPTHYGISGEANGWGSKWMLLWLAGSMVFCFAIMKICSFFPRSWNLPMSVTAENIGRVLLAAKNMLAAMNLTVLLLFAYLVFSAASATELNMWIFLPLMLLVFVPIIGFYVYIKRPPKEEA